MISIAAAIIAFAIPYEANADVYAVPEKRGLEMTAPIVQEPLLYPDAILRLPLRLTAGEPTHAVDAEPRLNPHPPIVIPSPNSVDEVAPTPDGFETELKQLLGKTWPQIPNLLLALFAGLIWREIRAANRPKPAEQTIELTPQDPLDEEDVMPEQIEEKEVQSPWIAIVGGSSHRGQTRSENQDAYAVREIADGITFAGSFDGVGGQPGGRTASRYASRKVKSRIAMGLTVGLDVEDAILEALGNCPDQMADDGIEGLTTALVAVTEEDRLTWAGLGDGRICVIHPDGMSQDLLAPHNAPDMPSNVITAHLEAGKHFTARLGSIRLEPGSLVFTMSDGAGDLFNLEGLATRRKQIIQQIKSCGPELFCDGLLTHLEGLTHKDTGAILHSDNLTMTVQLVEKAEG